MDFDKLKTFYQVATAGSISKVIESLQMNKSTISRQLSLLEEQVGKQLFERRSQKLVLTPHGSFLLKRAGKILMEVEAVKAALTSDEKHLKGHLTISTTHALTSTWLTYFFHGFAEKHPELLIQIKATNQLLNLSLREADLALRPYCENQDDLVQKHLMRWRLGLYASKSYLDRFGTPKSPADLNNHRLIVFEDSPNLYSPNHTNWPLTKCTHKGIPRKPFMILNSLEGMYNLVCNGMGIGNFAHDFPLFKWEKLYPILPKQMYQDIDLYYIYHKQFEGLEMIVELERYLFNYVKTLKKALN